MAEDNNNEIKKTSDNSNKNTTEEEGTIPIENTEDQNNSPNEIKSEEPKLLEEREHFELEYFSKDEKVEEKIAEVKAPAVSKGRTKTK